MGGSVKTGLKYQSVLALMDVYYPEEDKADLMKRIQILESESLVLFNAE